MHIKKTHKELILCVLETLIELNILVKLFVTNTKDLIIIELETRMTYLVLKYLKQRC